MKLLWIEDGGGNLAAKTVGKEIFSGILSQRTFENHDDEDEEFYELLPRLFQDHTCHELVVAVSYREWVRLWKEHDGDFDAVLIDLNLEKYPTPKSDWPIPGLEKFDKEAGLYIYNCLIRDEGFPEENIAFFTGQGISLRNFEQACTKAHTRPPSYTFEKKDEDFQKITRWIDDKAASHYLTLRRATRNGAKHVERLLGATEDPVELERRLLFYKTTSNKVSESPDVYRNQVVGLLKQLLTILPLRQPKEPHFAYRKLIEHLSQFWAMSEGKFRDGNDPKSRSSLEESLLRSTQHYMTLVLDLITQDVYSHKPSASDAAATLLLALRGLVHIDFQVIYRYERLVEPLFTKRDDLAAALLHQELESALRQSFLDLRAEIKEKLNFNKPQNYFSELFLAYREPVSHVYTGSLAQRLRYVIQEQSTALVFQEFWHSMFPLWFEESKHEKGEVPRFSIERMPGDSFLTFFALLTFARTFHRVFQTRATTPFEVMGNRDYPTETKRVFAIVAEAQRNIYEDHIRPACEMQELRCSSQFDLEDPAGDTARICEELQRAQLIVADITDLDANVLCEVGIAISMRDQRYIALLCRDSGNQELRPQIPNHLEKLQILYYTDESLESVQLKLAELFLKAQLIDRRSGEVIQNLEARKLIGTARQRTSERDWIAAEILFSAADQREPENWYIFMCWGIMCRDQAEYVHAEKKFDIALDCCELEQEKARVYSEKAFLAYRRDRDANTAEEWFRKAVAADKLNKKVFFSWAEFYEELGDYRRALEKVIHVLGQIDGDDEEAKRRFEYYSVQLSDSPFGGSYKDYLNHCDQLKRKPRPKTPATGDSVPWNADWATLRRYSGKSVRARVKDPHPRLGVFVRLCRDFDGLIPPRFLEDSYEKTFRPHREVSVVIEKVEPDPKTGKPRISLRPDSLERDTGDRSSSEGKSRGDSSEGQSADGDGAEVHYPTETGTQFFSGGSDRETSSFNGHKGDIAPAKATAGTVDQVAEQQARLDAFNKTGSETAARDAKTEKDIGVHSSPGSNLAGQTPNVGLPLRPSPAFEISVLHPRKVPKGRDSVFVLRIYVPIRGRNADPVRDMVRRRNVARAIERDREELEAEEEVFDTELQEGLRAEVNLHSSDLTFRPASITATLRRSPLTVNLTGRPTDDCRPARHPIALHISDSETKNLLVSERFTVTVVDYAFGRVSRPFVGNVMSGLAGVASLASFVLMFLGKIDATLGLTSGTTALAVTAAVQGRVNHLYRSLGGGKRDERVA